MLLGDVRDLLLLKLGLLGLRFRYGAATPRSWLRGVDNMRGGIIGCGSERERVGERRQVRLVLLVVVVMLLVDGVLRMQLARVVLVQRCKRIGEVVGVGVVEVMVLLLLGGRR